MEKTCLNCPNLYYDEIRAKYKCRYTGKVVYDEKKNEECWGIYVPDKPKEDDK